MTHKSKQSSGSKKDYAALYANLLEQKLPLGPRPKWDKVYDNRDKFNTLDEYYKAAYLALKADLKTKNTIKKNEDNKICPNCPLKNGCPYISVSEPARLNYCEYYRDLKKSPNISPSIITFYIEQRLKMKQSLKGFVNPNLDHPYVSRQLCRQIDPDRLN